MGSIKNYVHLLGNIGDDPKVSILESGTKMARFAMATNESFKDSKGERKQRTEWHTIVSWGKTAEIVESFVSKGRQVAVVGKLHTRTYTNKDGIDVTTTEIVANEILLLGNKSDK